MKALVVRKNWWWGPEKVFTFEIQISPGAAPPPHRRERLEGWVREAWLTCLHAKSLVSRLCDPVDCSPVGSFVHGILQARILEWVAIPVSSGSSWPWDHTWVSCIAGRFFTIWATTEAQAHPQIQFDFTFSSTCKHTGYQMVIINVPDSCLPMRSGSWYSFMRKLGPGKLKDCPSPLRKTAVLIHNGWWGLALPTVSLEQADKQVSGGWVCSEAGFQLLLLPDEPRCWQLSEEASRGSTFCPDTTLPRLSCQWKERWGEPFNENRSSHWVFLGFPGGSAGKENACNAGDLGLITGLGRSPGEGKPNSFKRGLCMLASGPSTHRVVWSFPSEYWSLSRSPLPKPPSSQPGAHHPFTQDWRALCCCCC